MVLGTTSLPADGLREPMPSRAGYGRPVDAGPVAATTVGAVGRQSDPGLFHHPVIRFIRENRLLTIAACVGVLAAMWLTANFSFRRRR